MPVSGYERIPSDVVITRFEKGALAVTASRVWPARSGLRNPDQLRPPRASSEFQQLSWRFGEHASWPTRLPLGRFYAIASIDEAASSLFTAVDCKTVARFRPKLIDFPAASADNGTPPFVTIASSRTLADMIKSELIQIVAGRNPHLYHSDVEKIVETILETMAVALEEGGRVEMRGFGTLSIRHRPSRSGRNPRNGKNVFVEEKWVPFFKAGRDMQDRLNSKEA